MYKSQYTKLITLHINLFYFRSVRENNSLHRTVEKLKAEVKQLREQCEELSENRADAMRELSELKERFQLELNDEHIVDLIDNTSNGENMDHRLTELRTEVSHLYYTSTCSHNIYVLYIIILLYERCFHIFMF